MKIAWITDLHLDSKTTGDAVMLRVSESLRRASPDAALVTGDIANADTFPGFLMRIAPLVPSGALYFVLGNHDFYGNWISVTREAARCVTGRLPGVRYLSSEEAPIEIAPGVCLIGHDCWGDAGLGETYDSSVMKDARRISNLISKSDGERRALVGGYGAEAASHLTRVAGLVPDHCRKVLVATHVPPFLGRRPTEDKFLPHVVCTAAGRALSRIARAQSERTFSVFCGHIHQEDRFSPLPNLEVRVGESAVKAEDPVCVIEV